MPSIGKTFDLMGDHLVELTTKNENLKYIKFSEEEKWLEESKATLLKEMKEIDDGKETAMNMTRRKKITILAESKVNDGTYKLH